MKENLTPEIETGSELLNSIDDMHCIASGSLSRIRGIAKCALRSLETSVGVRDLEAMAGALQAIIIEADVAYNNVGCVAEHHGIQTIDKARTNRLDAMCKAAIRASA